MRYVVTLLQPLSPRPPRAVQAAFRLADGTVSRWPVTIHHDPGVAEVVVESGRDMLADASARSLVVHYAEPPEREERQISTIRAE